MRTRQSDLRMCRVRSKQITLMLETEHLEDVWTSASEATPGFKRALERSGSNSNSSELSQGMHAHSARPNTAHVHCASVLQPASVASVGHHDLAIDDAMRTTTRKERAALLCDQLLPG